MRFAIVGCGRMGRWHIERLREDGRGVVAALFDVQPRMAENLQRELAADATVCPTFAALLQIEGIDAAIICTPTTSHVEQVHAARSRGWHVLCEKPLADSRQGIQTLIDLSRSGPALRVAYQRRSWGVYRTLRREIRSGRWGDVRSITSQNAERWQQTIAGTWRDDPAINIGGFVGDAGSHKIDAVFYVTRLMPVQVFATSDKCGSRVEIVTNVAAGLQNDVPLNMSFVGNAECFVEDLHIHCAEASLLLRDRRLWIARNNELLPVVIEADSNPVSDFLDQLLDGVPNEAPADCALPVFDFTQAILESGRSGQAVRTGSGL